MNFKTKTEGFMEDFIAYDEEKELARVAYRRARSVLKRGDLLRFLLFLGIGCPFVLLDLLPFSLTMAVIWGTGAAIFIPRFCRYNRIFSREYYKQLNKIRLERREKENRMKKYKFNKGDQVKVIGHTSIGGGPDLFGKVGIIGSTHPCTALPIPMYYVCFEGKTGIHPCFENTLEKVEQRLVKKGCEQTEDKFDIDDVVRVLMPGLAKGGVGVIVSKRPDDVKWGETLYAVELENGGTLNCYDYELEKLPE